MVATTTASNRDEKRGELPVEAPLLTRFWLGIARKRRERGRSRSPATCAEARSAEAATEGSTKQINNRYAYVCVRIGKRHFRTPSPTDGPRTPGDARFHIAFSLPRRPVIPELPCGWSFDARRAKDCRMQRTHARRV